MYKVYIALIFCFGISCSNNNQNGFDRVITVKGLTHIDGSIIPNTLQLFGINEPITLDQNETLDFYTDPISSEISLKKVKMIAGDFKDSNSRFQIVLYDSNNNGRFDDHDDKIFVNYFGSSRLFTQTNEANILFKPNFIVKMNELYFEVIIKEKFFTASEIQNGNPDIVFFDKLGKTVLLDMEENKSVVEWHNKGINFIYYLSGTCKYCLEEIPKINELITKFPNLKVIGLLPISESIENWSKIADQIKGWKTYKFQNTDDFNPIPMLSLPDGYIVDSDGYILSAHIGTNDLFELLKVE